MKTNKKAPLLFVLSLLALSSCGGASHKHSYGNPEWFWSETESGYAASATFTCGTCEETVENHKVTFDASVNHETEDADCTNDGSEKYTASVTFSGKTYTDTKEIDIPAYQHDFSDISISGDYKKEYVAFEEFDTSKLVVESVCQRCNTKVQLTSDDYFVVYQQFGASSLSVGDTKVTISYNGIRKDITGLTVSPITIDSPSKDTTSFTYNGNVWTYNVPESIYYTVSGNTATDAGTHTVTISLNDKVNYVWDNGSNEDLKYDFVINPAENNITGFATSYQTTCHTAPVFEGVSATFGEVTYKYYRDSNCLDEVSLDELEAGSYYVKAISASTNCNTATAVATLTVEHKFDQEAVRDDCLVKASTEFKNAVYYKSCKCGAASESETFEAQGTKLPSVVAASSVSEYEVVDMVAPEGFSTVTKGTKTYNDDEQGKKFLANHDITAYSKVWFAFKTANRRLCHSSWENALPTDTWYNVTITRNANGTFSSVITGLDGEEFFGYDEFATFQDALLYYNYDGDQANMEWYSTEIKGQRLDSYGVQINPSSVEYYEKVQMAAPLGFETVTKGTYKYSDSDQGHKFLAGLDLYNYQTVKFGFRTEGRPLCDNHWENCLSKEQWYIVTIERNQDNTFSSEVATTDGTVKFGYSEFTSFRDALLYYNYGGDDMTWYSTEVRGIEREGYEPILPVGEVIDSSAISGCDVKVESCEDQAPRGYESVTKFLPGMNFFHGKFYSGTDLSSYSEVNFALKTNGYYLFNGWGTFDDSFDWILFTLTNKGDMKWDLVAKHLDGKVVATVNDMSGYKGADPGVYTNNALNAILYGVPSNGYTASERTGRTLTLFATELRGVKA